MLRKVKWYKIIICAFILLLNYSFLYQQTMIEHTKFYSFFRYKIDIGWLYDNLRKVHIEGKVFADAYEFPYLYTIGRSGFTKVNILPFVGKIEKVVNYEHYSYLDKVKKHDIFRDDTLDILKEEYGAILVLRSSVYDMTEEDQRVYVELKRKVLNRAFSQDFLDDSVAGKKTSLERIKAFLERLERS